LVAAIEPDSSGAAQ